MRDLPILFSAPMVKALLAGTKTQTRRIHFNQSPEFIRICDNKCDSRMWGMCISPTCNRRTVTPTKIHPGDRLWVKETWKPHSIYADLKPSLIPQSKIFFRTDDVYAPSNTRWWPSLFMPRWASRITLLVDDVRVERLQAVSDDDAIAEGIEKEPYTGSDPQYQGMFGWKDYSDHPHAVVGFHHEKPVLSYRSLWDSINGDGAWDLNPWVVAYTFRVVLENIEHIGRAA